MKKLFLLLFVVLLCGAAFGQTVVTGAPGTIVVARVTKTGQTGTINDTTIFTPSTLGMYRVSVYIGTTAAGTGGTVTGNIKYYPDPAMVQRVVGTSAVNLTSANNQANMVATFTADAAKAISYNATVASGAGSFAYRIDIVLERLY